MNNNVDKSAKNVEYLMAFVHDVNEDRDNYRMSMLIDYDYDNECNLYNTVQLCISNMLVHKCKFVTVPFDNELMTSALLEVIERSVHNHLDVISELKKAGF